MAVSQPARGCREASYDLRSRMMRLAEDHPSEFSDQIYTGLFRISDGLARILFYDTSTKIEKHSPISQRSEIKENKQLRITIKLKATFLRYFRSTAAKFDCGGPGCLRLSLEIPDWVDHVFKIAYNLHVKRTPVPIFVSKKRKVLKKEKALIAIEQPKFIDMLNYIIKMHMCDELGHDEKPWFSWDPKEEIISAGPDGMRIEDPQDDAEGVNGQEGVGQGGLGIRGGGAERN